MMDADEPPEYGRTIVNLLENFSQVRYLPSVAGILEDTCQIERRIKMIADYKKTSRSRWAGAVLLLVVLASVVLTNACVAKGDMPTPRFGLTTSVVDRKIYAIGGGSTGGTITVVEEYDPATDTWMRKADMPTGRAFFSASVVNGKIYAIGGLAAPGGAGLRTVEEYDPATDTWTRKADMPTPRLHFSTSAVDGRIYAIGGMRTDSAPGLTTLEEYDPATDTWTRKADMPTARICFSTSVANGRIYAISGCVGAGASPLSTVEEYDPATDNWTKKADIPTARLWFSTTSVNGRIFAIGGCTGPYSATFSTVEEYDPVTDAWTRKDDMPTARKGLSASAVNGKIYAIGGRMTSGWSAGVSTVEEYDQFSLFLDFNRDGKIDSADMCIMIDHWHTDEPSCDIGPTPFGDGIVDVQDLIVLAEYLFTDFRMFAHYKLDEIEGNIAHDSIGNNDGTLYGEPIWRPTDGMVDGALEFDGIDDYVETDFILDPSKGSFSVFAWIKGGAPGQVIISQTDGTGSGAAWLWADSSYGRLITRLMHPPFDPLVSESVITDVQWRHVGLVYDFDELKRCLYVDGAEVAKDTDFVGGMSVDGGLYFGTGKTLDTASFFSGLIDDIRIYNVALSAEEVAELAR
jgi:N-acetylneuraminic acid mutarotase